ncbi:TonB family protein [Variovorax sp. 54]|nr:TonB family protein [Variovorax sp. 54]
MRTPHALLGAMIAALLPFAGFTAPQSNQQPAAGLPPKPDICAVAIHDPAHMIDEGTRQRFTQDFNDGVARNEGGLLRDVFDQPPMALSTVPPRYPAWARRCGVEGRVIIDLVIGLEGEVALTQVLGNPPRVLADAAVLAVRQWRFQPQTLDGQPVRARFRQPVNFLLTPSTTDPEASRPQAVIGRKNVSPEDARKSLQLSYASARLESQLGAGVRVVDMQTLEWPLLDYVRAVQSRMDAIEVEEGAPLVNRNLRVALTVNGDGSIANALVLGSANEAAQQRAEQAARRAATLGPLPRVPGSEIKQIVFVLPFETGFDRFPQTPSNLSRPEPAQR